MSVEKFPSERVRNPRPSGLPREEIERLLAKGRRERAEAFARAAARAWRAARRLLEVRPGEPQPSGAAGRARS